MTDLVSAFTRVCMHRFTSISAIDGSVLTPAFFEPHTLIRRTIPEVNAAMKVAGRM
jgi:hypothetical protein